MLFNSLHFVIFFPFVCVVYYSLPYRFRTLFLLVASYYFYVVWIPIYLLVILYLTLLDFYLGKKIERETSTHQKRGWLILSIFFNVGLLFLFKYYAFLDETLNHLLACFHMHSRLPMFNLALPLGISFHTFQSLGYIMDIYRGKRPAEKNLATYALFVAYFPQLVAGPIERSTGLLPQLSQRYEFDFQRTVYGLRLMVWGFFKKLVIADQLAPLVDAAYNAPTHASSALLMRATYYFAIQIYCDFSGYTDIARGASLILGPALMVNFRSPYTAANITDFWHRWHISLSTWFRDYLYIPLGGSHVPRSRWIFNILVVFLLSGLWHGAKWTFVLWGGLHGLYYIISFFTRSIRQVIVKKSRLDRFPRLHRTLQTVLTFHMVTIAWVFFRANSVSDAYAIFRQIGWEICHLRGPLSPYSLGEEVTIGAIFIVLLLEGLQPKIHWQSWLDEQPILLRWSLYLGCCMAILILGETGARTFIYFQF